MSDLRDEDVASRPEVRQALRQTGGAGAGSPARLKTVDLAWLGSYGLLLLALGAAYYLIRLDILGIPDDYAAPATRLAVGAMAIVLVLSLGRLANSLYICRLDDPVTEYNLRRILRVVLGITIGLIVVSILFANWYTAAVSLGLLSLILGFALQTPITSFIGWIYILVRAPYRIGDRIRIGDATGDVIDVGYLDTTLWEFGGEYLSTDHPSGRVIRFPNSDVLDQPVFNYSWPLFPFIWNEIGFQVAYDSDLEFVARTMSAVAVEAVGEEMRERVRTFRELLAKTPVDQLDVQEEPSMVFRVSSNTWIEATVRYLVDPRLAGTVKTRLVAEMLTRLNAEPDRVLFPKSNMR